MIKRKKVYFRNVNSSMLKIYQLIFFKVVLTYSNNKSLSNGDLGKKFSIKKRSETNL